jgi:3'-phosphoadenosine 5'-phosphosulfate (PAPS) 3'-phosphatase
MAHGRVMLCAAPRRAARPSRCALRTQKYQYCWIVDPLDGTKEFIKRVPHFTVNVALVKGNAPIMGVVVTPAADTMHFAIKGQGAFVRCAAYVHCLNWHAFECAR